ncbi:uncharacterized protein LOC125947823 [Dermacentor silvarum]|uniref:uncharacterized protein LOC125947823 n=1 Tax=Dermacentor silvarum TaxID=543639 RepID=UPI002100A7B8|nr:uncharacterized protein LOC125947823 [Dermacentor silvarum]
MVSSYVSFRTRLRPSRGNRTAFPSNVRGFLVPLRYPEQTTRAAVRYPLTASEVFGCLAFSWPTRNKDTRRLPGTRCVLATSGNSRDEFVLLHETATGEPQTRQPGARHPTRHRHPEPCIRAAASRQRQSPEQTTVLPAPDHPHPTSGLRTSATWKQHILVLRPIVLRHFGGLSNTSREDTTIMKTSYTQKRTPNKQIFPE